MNKTGLFLLVLLACAGNKEDISGEIKFQTRDDSELFFKNVRQSYYDLEERKDAKMNLYRFGKRNQVAPLNLVIAHHWRNDRAYVMLEWSAEYEEALYIKLEGTQDTITYIHGSVREQAGFARDIYVRITKGDSLTLSTRDNRIPFLQEEKDLEAFRITMKDFFKLVGMN